jgi:hypothetical protein
MSFLQMLSDPNVQKFAVLLAPALLAIPSSWVVNQLPSAQSANRFVWLWLKLLVEIAFFLALINFWPDVAKIISDSNATPQLANLVYLLYFLGLLLLLIPAILDGWQLWHKRSPAQTIADEKAARRRDLRQALMDEVQHKWIRGVLEKENSLYHRSRLELGLQACPDLVRHLDSRQQQHWRSLPVGTRIFDEFVDLGEGGTLLIVGEPGGGKTTLLLELARDLLAVTAATDPEQPVPVVLNLSTWGKVQKDRQPIATLAGLADCRTLWPSTRCGGKWARRCCKRKNWCCCWMVWMKSSRSGERTVWRPLTSSSGIMGRSKSSSVVGLRTTKR